MSCLSNLAKKLLDSDTQTLIKAGFLDSELELTTAGGEAIQQINFLKMKDELVAEANKLIEERAKE